jgi:hypothetical protein
VRNQSGSAELECLVSNSKVTNLKVTGQKLIW